MKWLLPPVLLLICLALMSLLRWLWPLWIVFPPPYNRLGVVAVVAGLLLALLAILRFRSAGTNLWPFREADTLVTDGVYRYSRNPIYLGDALILLGAWVWLGALSSVLGVLIFVVVTDRWYIRSEEQMLQRKFGSAFDAYRTRTRRWL
jgi:protein-S-isoprenylcysteine O-methyltransferase Ste14